jgi:hypothetical protein
LPDNRFWQGFFCLLSAVVPYFTRFHKNKVLGALFKNYEGLDRAETNDTGTGRRWQEAAPNGRSIPRCPVGKLSGKVGHKIPVLGLGCCRQPRFQIADCRSGSLADNALGQGEAAHQLFSLI